MQKRNTKENIIYIASALSTFVKSDINILSKKYNVIVNTYNWSNKKRTPEYMLRQMFFLLKHLFNLKSIIISSGGYWSFFPALIGKIFNINVFIVLNGSDCASIPNINYGSLRKKTLRKVCEISYKYANTLLPVSSSLIYTKNTFYSDDEFSYQGLKVFFPSLKTETIVVHNAIDSVFWKQLPKIQKEEKSFISVFSGIKQFNLKGGDLIVKVAKYFPDCKFYLAGLSTPEDLEISENVIFLGKLTPNKLREYYSRSQYYFQLSIFEGFGVALCEAMLCECVPIGSSVNIIPEIIGKSGFVLNKKDLFELKNLIEKVLLVINKKEFGYNARLQIMNKYSIKKREEKLISLIEK